jgi:hypothetical protein
MNICIVRQFRAIFCFAPFLKNMHLQCCICTQATLPLHSTFIMPTVWNTHLGQQTFEHLLKVTIMLQETVPSDASSLINDMDWSFDTVLDLLDDDDDNSTIGAVLKLVVESRQQQYNTIMSSVQECVEWGFALVIQQFQFLYFSKQM